MVSPEMGADAQAGQQPAALGAAMAKPGVEGGDRVGRGDPDAGALGVGDNGSVAMLEGLLVVGTIGVLLYLAIRALLGSQGQEPHPVLSAGHWLTSHYDVDGHTKVVVQKVTPAGTHVLDEHVIAEIKVSDPNYDELFMTAMAAARQRQAIFETEE